MPPTARRILPALLLAASLLPARASAQVAEPTTVVVVRHAERASDTDRDSPLSAAGEARARALADALADAGVSAIYTTQYRRTAQTAAPLAARLGVAARADSLTDASAYVAELASRIRTRHAGETVLVVGHSNTVGMVVRALGGAEIGDLEHGDYDNAFIVLLRPDGTARTLRTRYGGG